MSSYWPQDVTKTKNIVVKMISAAMMHSGRATGAQDAPLPPRRSPSRLAAMAAVLLLLGGVRGREGVLSAVLSGYRMLVAGCKELSPRPNSLKQDVVLAQHERHVAVY